ncbi:nitrogen fixation protein NifZ [Derxia gummosa]|uniref:Nitrogen fixation protein NifZ n=1 Tax=Derxia gummosa DSM 723 TaxID=1121388 RepID=A0A8B6X1X2_9BURK|nr:nitrogen fixation protein NifZ [Derxia gummosa]
MSDIVRDSEVVEITEPPRFGFGERVMARSVIRNDGTFNGLDVGVKIVDKGDLGYVRSIGTFLQQYYIYAVEFVDKGYQVGMRAKELCTLDGLPDEIIDQLSPEAQAFIRDAGKKQLDEEESDDRAA